LSTADGVFDRVEFRDIVIVGGGCYGTFYAGQLARAHGRGRVSYREVLVVDRAPNCQMSRELAQDPRRQLVVRE
jgi:2-polyprenyl-6-methoxyphenol hydroxylase-like FAD-dependent oxidoreductase